MTDQAHPNGAGVLSVVQRVVDFFRRRARATGGGGTKAIEKQIASGKLTARDRIRLILDAGSFHEYDLFVEHKAVDFDMEGKDLAADGVITGTGHDRAATRSASSPRISPWPAARSGWPTPARSPRSWTTP